jgi:dihydrofolate synthase/folylpolyglutamate synthase
MVDFATSTHPGVQAQLDRLSMTSPAGDRLGLERVLALLDRLGRPQEQLPPVFHVAGTNGKGSTIAFLRAALEASGRSVHVFTSPHLVRFNERIRVAGHLIGDDWLADLLAEAIDAGAGIEPSFFEVATVVAFLAFARTPADACLVEVGLGGRLDATNVIEAPVATGIASIGLDHQQLLGDTLAEIAAEKAAIAKRGVPLVSLAQPPEAEEAIQRSAQERGAQLFLEGRDWTVDAKLRPGLTGAHQLRNAALAWQMLKVQRALAISYDDFRAGIAKARWPARFQKLGDGPVDRIAETWVDGAHNAAAAEALAALLAERGPMHLILGMLANKDARSIVGVLAPHALSLTFVPVADHAHHDPAELARQFGGHFLPKIEDALAAVPGPRLVAGSLYLTGQVLAANAELPD